MKKKTLKDIYRHILFEKEKLYQYDIFEQWYDFICYVIDSKLYKPPIIKEPKSAPKFVCSVNFINKGMEKIGLSKIINDKEYLDKLPEKFEKFCVTYRLGNPIRNKVFNYKETVNSIRIKDPPSVTTCECNNSEFKDNNHGHIVTGDLRIVKDVKLRKLLSKGPNFREHRSINLNKCKIEIIKALENFIFRYKLSNQDINDWKNSIIKAVEERIYRLKPFVKFNVSKPVLKNDSSVACLEDLQKQFVIVPIDKASNNIAFVCKKFYIKRILDEVGVTDLPSDTYKICNLDIQNIVQNNVQICDKFGLKVEEGYETLPIIYWMPKMHKNPSGARFIIASSKCSTKPLSKNISYIFKLISLYLSKFKISM